MNLKVYWIIKKGGVNGKGKGMEVVVVCDEIEGLQQDVLEKKYGMECEVKVECWGMKDLGIIEGDGYYLRLR